ncbi:MAG: hypothetical protein ACLGJC_28310, partial [Alphaproteobacteria bacterium]
MTAPTTTAATPEELAAKLRLCAREARDDLMQREAAALMASADLIEAQARQIEALTAAEADRDALLGALGFKGGPLGDDLRRKVILDDAAALRPAMVKARRRADEAEAGAMLADGFVSERGGLLLRVWEMRAAERRKRREADARATTAEAALAAVTAERDRMREALSKPGMLVYLDGRTEDTAHVV